jgi:hypothetical protein
VESLFGGPPRARRTPEFYGAENEGTTTGMSRQPNRCWILCGSCLVLLAGMAATAVIWQHIAGRSTQSRTKDGLPAAQLSASTAESRIKAFCGNCHAVPSPENFPRDAWHDEVLRGYEFYAQSGLTHLDPPPIHETVAYFRSRAPEEVVFPAVQDAATPLRVTFSVEKRMTGRPAEIAPAMAHLRWARLQPDNAPVLLVCDLRDGYVLAVNPNDATQPPSVLARLNNPCHAEPCDLDADGMIDLVVADLGSTVPYDHDLGRVIWLRPDEQRKAMDVTVVASGLGRVADVRPGDIDGDGDVDLVVADFGMHRTGQVLVLKNSVDAGGVARFTPQQIDPRPGAIHVPVLDLDKDGRLDFLALISQEYECVEAYLGQPAGNTALDRPVFRRHRLWTGPDLAFGSSGIEPLDMDRDGDVDVLYTNGDAFDNNYANPTHGIQWLENIDNERFEYHRLTDLIGAYRALAGDLDLDGDLDIVAVAWLPDQVKPASLRDRPLPAIVCLEQTGPGVFARHTLETGAPRYATLELADFDGDGDLDFAVGSHLATTNPAAPWLTIWRNQTKGRGDAAFR